MTNDYPYKTYRDLKMFLLQLTSEQLDQVIGIHNGDTDETLPIMEFDVSKEDFYHDHGEPLGTKKQLSKRDLEHIQDFTLSPAGSVFLCVNHYKSQS